MLNIIVVLELSSVYSDNITNSLDNWEVFKGFSEEYDVDVVELSTLNAALVGYFTGDNVSLLSLVWERGVNDNSIEVVVIFLSFFSNVSEFGVLVVVL